ncbi:hypothetical protein EJ08DRAFT_52209 [Tothia fuscella]|uniref:Zn(2)-C6 fungal-type domain-containing protein n=1 Tax=Tothia fuscella TaxID=1048955 RepID=A0A9P4TSL3_9PEZI|nr:hypothetical protein EJ08DRAFT_52209 [Tothia fuscella]
MPSRRPHEKRRNGCHQCKTRRVKCDLQLPTCTNCARRSETCIRNDNPIPTQIPPSNHPLQAATTPWTHPLPLLDLELMHHFTTVVYSTLTDATSVQKVWQNKVPKEALPHNHLMHAILALSALHLQSLPSSGAHPLATYRKAAIHHYGMALSQLQPLVVQIDPLNCGAVLVSSALLSVFAAANTLLKEEGKEESCITEGFQSCHRLGRGVAAIVLYTRAQLSRVKYQSLINTDGVPHRTKLQFVVHVEAWDDITLPTGFKSAMDNLRAQICTLYANNDANRGIYLSAIHVLQETVKAEIQNPLHVTLSLAFLSMVDGAYMYLLAIRDPMALVILAYYAAILHRRRRLWWLGSIGVEVLGEIKQSLKGEFEDLILWPEGLIGRDVSVEGVDMRDYFSYAVT